MAPGQQATQLAEQFTRSRSEYADPLARWFGWCLQQGVDPQAPPRAALADYRASRRSVVGDVSAVVTWQQWCRNAEQQARAAKVPVPRERPNNPDSLSEEATVALLRSAAAGFEGHAATAAMFLLASDRRFMVARLTWLDVDNIVEDGDELRLQLPHGGPLIALAPVVCTQIAAHIETHPKAREVATSDGHVRKPLLRSRTGGRVAHGEFCKMFRTIAAHAVKAGIDLGGVDVMPTSIQVVDLRSW